MGVSTEIRWPDRIIGADPAVMVNTFSVIVRDAKSESADIVLGTGPLVAQKHKIQSNPLNGSPYNGSIRLLVQVLVSPIFVLY